MKNRLILLCALLISTAVQAQKELQIDSIFTITGFVEDDGNRSTDTASYTVPKGKAWKVENLRVQRLNRQNLNASGFLNIGHPFITVNNSIIGGKSNMSDGSVNISDIIWLGPNDNLSVIIDSAAGFGSVVHAEYFISIIQFNLE